MRLSHCCERYTSTVTTVSVWTMTAAWGARWCHREKGDGVRSRFLVKQFNDAKHGDFFTYTPRAEAMRILLTAATLLRHTIYHERLQRGNHVHASEGGARDPGPSTTRIRSRRDGVETEEVSVRAARSGATFSGVSETSLPRSRGHTQRDRTRTHRRCCGKIKHTITCRPDLMHPLKRAWQTSQQSAGRRQEMSQAPAERHPRNHGHGDGASNHARLEARPWQHRLPIRTGPDVTRRGSSRVVASPGGAA